MRFTRYITLSIIVLFIIPSFIPSCMAATPEDGKDNERPVTDLIMETIFKMGTAIPGVGWYHQEFIPPSFYKVTPEVIDLEYFNETVFEIAEIWPDGTIKKAAFQPPDTPQGIMERHLYIGQTFAFELIPPENTSANWLAYFEPDVIEMARDIKEGQEVPDLKTKCRLYLELPADENYPQQDTVLQIKITRKDISGNLWIPPKGHPVYGKGFGSIMWIFGAITVWGKYSGTTEYIYNNISILVRVNKHHKPSFIPPEPIKINENEVKSVPVEIQNLGSHIDTFNFRVYTDLDSDLVLSPPPALTLKPGDKATVSVGISSPQILHDPGSVHNIIIEMYSIDQPENIFSNSFTVTTAGVYISPFAIYYLMIFIIFIFIVVVFYKTIKDRLFNKVYKKPEKPWKITEEKEYLEKLKEKDKEKYNGTLEMMKDEYKSSLLWYSSYCKYLLKENKRRKQKKKTKKTDEKEARNFFLDLFKKKDKEYKETKEKKKKEPVELKKSETKPVKKEKIVETEVLKEEPVIKPKVDLKAEEERRKKERAIEKIKKQQNRK